MTQAKFHDDSKPIKIRLSNLPGVLPEQLHIHAGYCHKCGALMALEGEDGTYCPRCEPEKAPYNPPFILNVGGE